MQIRILLAIAALLTIGLSATAKAAIPNSQTGVFTGCYKPTDGSYLRLIDFQLTGGADCDGKLVGWNTAGPKGATGPAGPAGPKGATGPQGPAGPSFARGHFRTGEKFVGTSYETLATVDMPAGLYVLSGKASTYQHEILGTDWWAMVSCRLLQKSPAGAETVQDTSHTEVNDDYNERATLSLMGLAYVPAGQTDKLHLQCKDDGGVGGDMNAITNIKVIAQQVGGYSAAVN